ncbi:hypothetical protein XM38_012470 [Halomicronema hongdechloris C2206]|uniref:Uncharacterized protein n=1 Tax=Halomicronema hongdechloris C2206 TaxID=1641165 RepID=A0A1Z3HJ34_9CYAN|nr:hypothetical protein XM38_012470 [Halomicronema hongdechloris C2206]
MRTPAAQLATGGCFLARYSRRAVITKSVRVHPEICECDRTWSINESGRRKLITGFAISPTPAIRTYHSAKFAIWIAKTDAHQVFRVLFLVQKMFYKCSIFSTQNQENALRCYLLKASRHCGKTVHTPVQSLCKTCHELPESSAAPGFTQLEAVSLLKA